MGGIRSRASGGFRNIAGRRVLLRRFVDLLPGALICLVATLSMAAELDAEKREEDPLKGEDRRATGDWGGLRSSLNERGLTPFASYTTGFWSNLTQQEVHHRRKDSETQLCKVLRQWVTSGSQSCDGPLCHVGPGQGGLGHFHGAVGDAATRGHQIRR